MEAQLGCKNKRGLGLSGMDWGVPSAPESCVPLVFYTTVPWIWV